MTAGPVAGGAEPGDPVPGDPVPDDPVPATPDPLPRRVRVVGNSGAGKTTYARALAAALGVPHVELDDVFWAPGWVHRDAAEGRADLADRLAGASGWVVDGNWRSRLDGMLDDADAVVWLDHPRRVVMARVVRRTLWRGVTRQELWQGNRERLANLLRRDPEQNIVRWAWTMHDAYRARYAALAAQGTTRVVHLRSQRDADAWLRAVAAARRATAPDGRAPDDEGRRAG